MFFNLNPTNEADLDNWEKTYGPCNEGAADLDVAFLDIDTLHNSHLAGVAIYADTVEEAKEIGNIIVQAVDFWNETASKFNEGDDDV